MVYLHTPHFRITLETLTASHLHRILEIFYCDPKGRRALLRVPRLRSGKVFAYVGRIHNLKDLKEDILVGKPSPQRHVLPWKEFRGFMLSKIVGARNQI